MIITTVAHGRSARDTRNIAVHLGKQVGQHSRVVAIDNVPFSNSDEALAYMETMRDACGGVVAYHHLTINPSRNLTDAERDEAVRRVLGALDAEDHGFIVWEHSEKRRNGSDVDRHYHVVVSNFGPDLKALNSSHSYAQLEAVARTLEVDLGETLTPSRRTQAVKARLVDMGRSDVAEILAVPDDLPRSSMTRTARAKASRHGLDLPDLQQKIRDAWSNAENSSGFRSALKEHGIDIAAGTKKNVWIASIGDHEIGALDRIVKEKRAAVAQRMGVEHDRKSGPDESPESGVRSVPRSAPSRAAVAAVALSARSSRDRGRDEPNRKTPGHSGGSLAGAAAAASILGGSARQSGRAQLETAKFNGALKTFEISLDAKRAAAQIRTKSLRGARPQLSSALLSRRIGTRLDQLWMLAMEVRDVITDIRLRIRFGNAQRHSADPEPVRQVELSPAELIKKPDPEYGVTHVHVRPF